MAGAQEAVSGFVGQRHAGVEVSNDEQRFGDARFRGSQHQEAVGRQTIAFNEALERASRAHGAELGNLYAASRREVPLRPELISADGYHPSDAGYARWAELVWAGVAARMADR